MNKDLLSDKELTRYARQIMLPSMDIAGQERLKAAHVLVVGLGGLGSSVAQALAAAGIGQLTLQDHDSVELSNLPRQYLHNESRIGSAKVISAAQSLQTLSPTIELTTQATAFNPEQDVSQYACVVDCTDNLDARMAINQACFEVQTPLVCGAAIRFEGQLGSFFTQPDSACYGCVAQMFDTPNETCSEAGVLSPVVGVIGMLQACEVLKIISRCGTPLHNQWLIFDVASMQSQTYQLKPHAHCATCNNQ